jgi:signal peptidase I
MSRLFYAIFMKHMEKEQMLDEEMVKQEPEKTLSQSFWELVRFALIALIIVIPIRLFVAEPFVVSGSSMFPTFENGNYLIVDKISYRFHRPERDDVIVFKYPNDPSKYFIKRIIGLPGEKVEIKGSVVTIINADHPDGIVLDQPFVENNSENNSHYELGADEYFVMGDNRNASSDSRYWGPLNKKFITGQAFLRLLPVTKISINPGNYKQTE